MGPVPRKEAPGNRQKRTRPTDPRRWTPLAKQKRPLNEGLVLAQVDKEEKKGCLLEVRCRQPETLSNPEFREFARELCAQVLEKGARYVARQDVPWETIRTEERAHRTTAEASFATSDRIDDYLLEKMSTWYSQVCLLEQPFRQDPARVVGQVLEGLQQALGDQIEVRRFSNFDVGNDKN